MRISTEALVFPAAEYCAPVWSRSPHVKKLDAASTPPYGLFLDVYEPLQQTNYLFSPESLQQRSDEKQPRWPLLGKHR